MAETNKKEQKPEAVNRSTELLKKSADLKARAASLKQRMDETHKACEEMLHPEKDNILKDPEN